MRLIKKTWKYDSVCTWLFKKHSEYPLSSTLTNVLQGFYFYYFGYFIFKKIWSIYNVVLVSDVQHSDSVLHTHILTLLLILSPYSLLPKCQ